MRSTITIQDRLDLLVALPPSRLCQMLCIWSKIEDPDRVWTLLVWVEAQRLKRPAELSGRARARLKKNLFPGRSLERFMAPDAWFDATVFELVTESVLAPLLGAPARSPDPAALFAVLESWNAGSNHPFFAVRSLLDRLPEEAVQAVLQGGPLDVEKRAGRLQRHKQTPQLFHILLFLFRRNYLTATEVVNLFKQRQRPDAGLWKRTASGLRRYYSEMKAQHPSSRRSG